MHLIEVFGGIKDVTNMKVSFLTIRNSHAMQLFAETEQWSARQGVRPCVIY